MGDPGSSVLYQRLIRPLLFRLDAEASHHLALKALECLNRSEAIRRHVRRHVVSADPRLEVPLFGEKLPHPIGLAAGFDKNARVVPALFALGFSFVEVGAISAVAERGNPRPRIFRLPEHQSLINRMGLPNEGAAAIARRLAALPPPDGLLGANIVKPKSVPATSPDAIEAYVRTFGLLFPHVRFFSINISSPSSPDLRSLNAPADLRRLLGRLGEENARMAEETGLPPRDLLLKISPDLSEGELDPVLEIALEMKLSGIVATNTSALRPPVLAPHPTAREAGGLSGALLRARSTEVIRAIRQKTGGNLSIIGVGGVFTAEQAWEKLAAGADAVELYTGFVYLGPTIVGAVTRGLSRLLEARKLGAIREVIDGDRAPG
jgi:dihydroorotate dehydrogenase